jgi:hypothetical protein
MYQYFLKEINIKKINLNKILNNEILSINKTTLNLYLTNFGFHICEKNKIYKCKINPKNSKIINNFINKFTLYLNTITINKIEMSNIPYIHEPIQIEKIEIKINEKSNNSLIVELYKNHIHDLYFLSNENYDNLSIQEDISLFVKMLM